MTIWPTSVLQRKARTALVGEQGPWVFHPQRAPTSFHNSQPSRAIQKEMMAGLLLVPAASPAPVGWQLVNFHSTHTRAQQGIPTTTLKSAWQPNAQLQPNTPIHEHSTEDGLQHRTNHKTVEQYTQSRTASPKLLTLSVRGLENRI